MTFAGQTDKADQKCHMAAMTIVVCLYILSLLPLFTITSAAFLFNAQVVDQAIAACEVLIVISACVSFCYVLIHSIAAGRQMRLCHQQQQLNGLLSTCLILIRLVVMLWFAASAAGLVVSVRRPVCVRGDVSGSHWIDGENCVLQKASVAASVLAFFTSCALLASLEISDHPFNSHLLGISKYSNDKEIIFRTYALDLSRSKNASEDIENCRRRDRNLRGTFPSNHTIPIAVPALPTRLNHRPPGGGSMPRPSTRNYSLSAAPPSLPPIETRMPMNWGWGLAPMQNTLNDNPRMQSYSSRSIGCPKVFPISSTAISAQTIPIKTPTSSVIPLSRKSSSLRRSPLSTMRRASEPDVPIYEAFTRKRSQLPLKKSWSSTGTLDCNSKIEALEPAPSRPTLPEETMADSLILTKKDVPTVASDEHQHRSYQISETQRKTNLSQTPSIASSLPHLTQLR